MVDKVQVQAKSAPFQMIELIKTKTMNLVGFPNDHLFDEIKKGSEFDDFFLKEIIDARAKSDWCCIDAGANLGYVSIYLSRKCRKVYSFEPQPIVFLQLCANLFINECFNVSPFNLAAHSKECLLDFASYQGGWVGTNDFNDYNKIRSIGSISLSASSSGKMRAVRLDESVHEKVDFIKIDCQGADIDVLIGCQKIVDRDRPLMVMEWEEDLSTKNYNRPFSDLEAFAKTNQYKMTSVHGGNYLLEPL